MNSVFVYCELEGTQIEEVSFELLTKGRKLASELGVKLEAIVAGHDVKGKVESQILPYGRGRFARFRRAGPVALHHSPAHSSACALV